MKRLLTLLLALLLLALPACAAGETVVTSFFPIYVFALNLTQGIDGVRVESLTAPETGCLHDYQLQTGDMKLLNRADVFLINGAGMEGYLANVFEAFPELPVVDASVGVALLESCLEHDHGHGEEPAAADDHDHGDEAHEDEVHEAEHSESPDEPHDELHDDDDHGHSHEYNAHIWLDAQNAIIMVTNLAGGLMEELPAHAEAIRANRDAYIARLSALDTELKAAMSDLPHVDVITFHEAFPYFAEAYGVHVAAVLNHEPEDALSPRALAELCHTVMELDRPPLFIEPQYEDTAAQIVARETGAAIHTLDPIVTGPTGEIPLTFYENVMRANVTVLLAALSEE